MRDTEDPRALLRRHLEDLLHRICALPGDEAGYPRDLLLSGLAGDRSAAVAAERAEGHRRCVADDPSVINFPSRISTSERFFDRGCPVLGLPGGCCRGQMAPRRGKEISMKNRYLVDCALALFKIGVRVPEFPQLRKLADVGYLSGLLRRLRVNCVVDVGAHNGTYAYHLRRAGYSGEILSFEPVKEQFMQMTRLSHGDPAWRSFSYALGSDDTTGEFNVIKSGTERHVLSSLLDPDWDNLKLLADQTTDRHLERKEVVHIRRLDSILSELIPHTAPRLFLQGCSVLFTLSGMRWG
ncbi:MAG: FkbM family methyltransferase, partial [Rhodospirillales bacterium]